MDYTKEEYDRAVSEAYDNGYNAGKADAYLTDEYSVDENIWPDPDEDEYPSDVLDFTMLDRVD